MKRNLLWMVCGLLLLAQHGSDAIEAQAPPSDTTSNASANLDALRSEAATGDPKAMNRLGDHLVRLGSAATRPPENGKSYYDEAVQLFQKAIKGGNVDALGNLGVLYMNGQGVARDPKKAVDLFQQGAEAGSPFCMYYYAVAAEKGIGRPKGSTEAQRWFQQAAEKGNKQAARWCTEHNVTFINRVE